MQKKVLTEIDLYSGKVETPVNFEIDRTTIKDSIIRSYINKKRMSNNLKDYSYLDYKIEFSKPLSYLKDHVRDYFKADYGHRLIFKQDWGNVYEPKQQSFLRNTVEPVDLKNSPDYTFIYGVDIGKNSCDLVIEYDNNRRAGRTWHIPMKNNFFTLFPSTQKYFITPNQSKQLNIFLTTTYEYF